MKNLIYKVGDELIIINPTPDLLPRLRQFDRDIEIESLMHPENYEPLFQRCRRSGVLDQKLDLAMSSLKSCRLCALECKANLHNEAGICGIAREVSYLAPMTLVFEEEPMNPAINVYFSEKCCMNCVYCIAKESTKGIPLPFDPGAFWSQVDSLLKRDLEINTLEFVGGEPTLYLPWILLLLEHAPKNFNLPIVWNCSLYLSQFSLELLNGVVDVYLPDFRYPSDLEAKRFSGVDNYWKVATGNIEKMVKSKGKVIVRIMVLPEINYKRIFEFLSGFRERIFVSILDQYVPVYQARFYPEINRRPTRAELLKVVSIARDYGLRDVSEQCNEFWIEE